MEMELDIKQASVCARKIQKKSKTEYPLTNKKKFAANFLLLTYLLDVLQRDPVLSQLLVDKYEGIEIAHSPVQKLVGKITGAFYHRLVKLQQPGREK